MLFNQEKPVFHFEKDSYMPKQLPDNLEDKNLNKVIELCYEMLEFADHGDKFRHDDGCGIVYGTLRDVAYKIRRLAEQEISRHSSSRKKSSKKNGQKNSMQ